LIATLYSVGYAYAAVKSFEQNAVWMQQIKPVNVLTAVCLMVLIGLLYSPLLSPMRIGVQSQLARLNEGKVSASAFDYQYLRFSGGQYGDAALRGLLADTANPQAATIKPLVEAALKNEYRYYASGDNEKTDKRIATKQALQALTSVYPVGTQVDNTFYDAMFAEYQSKQVYFSCLELSATEQGEQKPHCHILAVDLNKDHQVELIVLNLYDARVYSKEAKGWRYVADMHVACCDNVPHESPNGLTSKLEKALAEGKTSVLDPTWQDLKVGGATYKINR
jgi:hypothetical protein